MMRCETVVLACVAALFFAPAASAKCEIEMLAVLPVTMHGRSPTTDGEINGRPVHFIIDSGAFYSTLSPAIARELKLPTTPLPPQFHMRGIGGEANAGLTKVREVKLADIPINNIIFLVGGSDTGSAGLIGQNILGIHDVEYDLEHGAVRLMRGHDCATASLAYWAAGKPSTVLPIEPFDQRDPHTIGTILVNGVKMRAGFDTGAASSVITPQAARRAGVTPESAGVVRDGYARGLGSKQVPSWRAPFDSIDMGGEKLKHVTLGMHELGGSVDMLIGIDFFLAHRVFVSNATHQMFFTYDGGPLFGRKPARVVSAEGQVVALSENGNEPTDAAGFSARGAASASKGDFAGALGDLNRAVALAPDDGRYLYQRAQVRLALRQSALAFDDLSKAIPLAPSDAEIRLVHGRLAIAKGDRPLAAVDARAADRILAPQAAARLALAGLFGELDDYEAALGSYESWLHFHAEDGLRSTALSGRCRALAALNRDLDKALSDCNTALKLRPNTAGFLNNRGLVHLRRGENDAAVSDYDAALALAPNLAMARYARGIAETRLGQSDAAERDRAAADAIDPRIAARVDALHL
ncbi:aspartyl protease family protein [Sphingobium nicotianae]|uniref:Aspartyl protease family protein n=1 Tax=Sphingobium nicotianae TaxID=2782607 RepID=A0A9X1DFE3_9SPHN|nr:aspartyl protease family protein [Sphingobium nicotianae]MBT2188843.1 aspartyl protease family protein [Sphingobium nicotianae]